VKILIVDDEEMVSGYFSQLAQIRKVETVDIAATGEDAMTKVIRQNYDLITLDINMPGASGLEIIAMLRNMCPHAIIAVISGFIPEEISSEVASCIDVLIPKPINIDIFNRLMESAEQISKIIDDIHNLGAAPVSVR